jgi:copper(I)-binding protein
MSVKHLLVATTLALAALGAHAEVTVKEPWVRATVPAQRATGAFMEIVSSEDARLTAARSPVAKTVEIHEMKMEGNVMKMRAISGLDLPAGKTVALTPGGYHVMLIGLKQQVKAGDTVPLTLVVQSKGGKREEIEVKAAVKAMGAEGHGHHH